MSHETLVVLVTAPNVEAAARLGHALVEERLAACANLVPGVRSIYRWEDTVQDEAETLLLIKTTAIMFERLKQRVLDLHSYDTPEVVALPVVAGSAAYLDWIAAEVKPEVSG